MASKDVHILIFTICGTLSYMPRDFSDVIKVGRDLEMGRSLWVIWAQSNRIDA